MSQNEFHAQIENHLYHSLKQFVPAHELQKYEYALFPTGKLFRPKLVLSLATDLNVSDLANHYHLANAIEIHHVYTLVHDDLPAMDDDNMRRGKLSMHKKYDEAQAILVGDGLLNSSYGALSQINHTALSSLLKLFHWCCGPKGLIQGQSLDLSYHATLSFSHLKFIHKLKTARLIQLSMVGSLLLSASNVSYRDILNCARWSETIGLSFQCLDDICEYLNDELSPQEKTINIMSRYRDDLPHYLKQLATRWLQFKPPWKNVNDFLNEWLEMVESKINPSDPKALPVVSFLQRIRQ